MSDSEFVVQDLDEAGLLLDGGGERLDGEQIVVERVLGARQNAQTHFAEEHLTQQREQVWVTW